MVWTERITKLPGPGRNRRYGPEALSPMMSVKLDTQQIMREQDRTIDSLVGTLSTLAQQAGLMGQEIVEHNE